MISSSILLRTIYLLYYIYPTICWAISLLFGWYWEPKPQLPIRMIFITSIMNFSIKTGNEWNTTLLLLLIKLPTCYLSRYILRERDKERAICLSPREEKEEEDIFYNLCSSSKSHLFVAKIKDSGISSNEYIS